MTIKSFIECEQDNLEKFEKFQLPSNYKKIGIIITIFTLILLILSGTIATSISEYSEYFKSSILLGLLIISISKDKNEDEFIIKLRMLSYRFAFLIGVIQILLFSPAKYLVSSILKIKESPLSSMGMFEILFILLFVQVFFFEYLKKLYK